MHITRAQRSLLAGAIAAGTILATVPVASGSATTTANAAGISPSVRAELRKYAAYYGRLDSDARPHDIEAVLTTSAKLRLIQSGGSPQGASTPTYVLAMSGHFKCGFCSPPAGAKLGPEKVVTLYFIEGEQGLVLNGRSYRGSYPDLKKLGAPIHLQLPASPSASASSSRA